MAGHLAEVDASCAICGAPPYPECPHEGESLSRAFNDAEARWGLFEQAREWVLNHARNQIILTFRQLREARYDETVAFLHSLPCYSLYQTYHGNPPLQPVQLQQLQAQIHSAQLRFKAGVDADWRESCKRYPEVLDYYFSLVDVSLPRDKDAAVLEPRFGFPAGPSAEPHSQRRLKGRRNSADGGHRKRERRRSRGHSPPTGYGRR